MNTAANIYPVTSHYLTKRVLQAAVNMADWTADEMLVELKAYGFAESTVEPEAFARTVVVPLLRQGAIACCGSRAGAPPQHDLSPDRQPLPHTVYRLAQRGARQ